MNIYEIEINRSFWWISAKDEFEATDLLVEELYSIEIGDEEMDEVMEELDVRELKSGEAESIEVVDDYGCSTYTLLDLYVCDPRPKVLTTTFTKEEEDEYDDTVPEPIPYFYEEYNVY